MVVMINLQVMLLINFLNSQTGIFFSKVLVRDLHINMRMAYFTGCMNVTYDPDDFTFTVVLAINNRVLYKNTLSGE
jgi:hypothetical protein